ncbi:MAG: helix-turn-helix domain-containing protein [Actinobacteria bacterium]|nr:helix-turn-helix domain-containing protein [Actinomycetota bacterium]
MADVPAEPTLGDLLEAVGVGLLELLAAPKGLDVAVVDAVIFDPDDRPLAHAGDVVLGVGVDVRRPEARDLLHDAGAAGAAAVVVKARDGVAPALVDAATQAGVALLAAAPEAAWGHLHNMVRTVTVTAGLESGTGPGGAAVGDLFALANAVAAMVGGPVTIEDPRSNVLAYSSLEDDIDDARRATILGRRVPDEWVRRLTDDGVFRRLFRERGVVRTEYPELGIKNRLATAVRAGDEILGLLWVQEGERPLGDEAEAALLEASRVAALHLLRHRSSADLERGRRAELLRAALDGRVSPDGLAPMLQIAPNAGLTVVVFELVDEGDVAAMSVLADRAASLVTLYCESYRRQAAVVAMGSLIYVVVPAADGDDRGRLPALAQGIVDRADEALHARVRAGIGSTVPSVAGLLASRQEADRVLRAMAARAWPGAVASVDDVRAHVVLDQLQELAAADPGLRVGKLDTLVDQDRERGTEYVATLRSFFAHLGDVPAAAKAQDVHANTFRYRLRRLAEVAGIDLDDPVERLVLQLQLQFLAD